ncbi:hypothetical protein HBI56_199180 [Parastagonospora nodorum]|uniref:Uncharacterized protein n=1 Tax=Phaeosphaeria nodorum (strain SN15 / ATCC MYA-4574 / FGSC 10173) TaxID=321614 RepID=A0A7U2FAI4_PHANO|nr:hypothetical protein HBH56_204160 [Parastagonospora nodorum]QRD01695.1 hypothetical protein JI435_145620 [Parastagonospora nodorum SN15]KAH3923943.1 hypothetical protein HBH54_203040 [Parastagonospora nodorum]KAH3941511.1 hypothetical protein HBH53_201280 [Parastagonospora nodorum]KAH3959602.1 hypothetical protein HBH51_199260 [Parastagonospora nodorum]
MALSAYRALKLLLSTNGNRSYVLLSFDYHSRRRVCRERAAKHRSVLCEEPST